MEVLVAEDGYIYIARDKEYLQHLRDMNQEATIQRQTVEHQKVVGNGPIKRDFTLVGSVLQRITALCMWRSSLNPRILLRCS